MAYSAMSNKRRYIGIGSLLIVLSILLNCGGIAPGLAASTPRLAQVTPANGAQEVPTDVGQLVLTFDQAMQTTSLSILAVAGYTTPPLLTKAQASDYWRDPFTCVLPVQALTPNTNYALQLNSAERSGFQTADHTPLPPTVLMFRTGAGPRSGSAPVNNSPTLVGTWLVRTPEIEILAVLNGDGTFTRQMRTAQGVETSKGRYTATPDTLTIYPEQDEPIQFRYRLVDANTLEVTDATGEGVQMVRQDGAVAGGQTSTLPASGAVATPAALLPPTPGTTAGTTRRPTVVFQRQWERNERAFSLLTPQGWQMEGGVFNVNPLQANGPGNSLAPKCDLTVKKDVAGSVMSRWLPSWNYADFSVEPTPSADLFPVGSQYQGMQVKPMPTAEGFLQELFGVLHPGATDIRLLARDDFPEILQAYQHSFQQTNQMLANLGKRPAQFDVLGLTVEYSDNGVRYREGLFTAIVDMRSGAFMWYNDHTYSARAPAAEAEQWQPVLETIRTSMRLNPDWVKAVTQAMGERAQMALETQRYINKVSQEIYENRARTNAKINYENYLLISGQDEYVNPYTQEVERDTSSYKRRWVNANGDYLYTDEDAFNPNQERALNQVEWKLTPVRPR